MSAVLVIVYQIKMIVDNNVVNQTDLNFKFGLPRNELEKMIDDNILVPTKEPGNVIQLRLRNN